MRVFTSLYHYDSYLEQLFSDFPSTRDKDFLGFSRWIEDDYALVFQGLHHAMCNLDGVESGFWTVYNCKPLQSAWAAENGLSLKESEWKANEIQILLRQIELFQPDVFLAMGFPQGCEFLKLVRERVPAIRVIASWDGARLHDVHRYAGADLILTCLDETVTYYAEHGFAAECLRFGFDERILAHLDGCQVEPRILFTGSIQISGWGHNQRLRLAARLLSLPEFEPSLDLTSFRHWRVWAGALKRGDLDHIVSLLRLFSRNRPPVYGIAMFRKIASSLVTVNVHIDAAGSFAGNVRLFETTGAGSCLVTDAKQNLSTLFLPDKEAIDYKSPEECLEKCRWLMNNPRDAAQIAKQGNLRTLREHTTSRRAVELKDILLNLINK